MNYYALFFENSDYFEKCITLIKFVSNSKIGSLPHITLRLFKELITNYEKYVENIEISYLNIIGPDFFKNKTSNLPDVVFLKCEAPELDGNEYKKDYPISRFHVTLYDGANHNFANQLLMLLNKFDWNYKIEFSVPRKLTEKKLGVKSNNLNYDKLKKFFYEMTQENLDDFVSTKDNSEEFLKRKLAIIETILNQLNNFINTNLNKRTVGDTNYIKIAESENSAQLIDESHNNIKFETLQMRFDNLDSNNMPSDTIKKPIRDAIYVTPPEYAREMATFALQSFGKSERPIRFGDSSIGTGALYIAFKNLVEETNEKNNDNYFIDSAIGVDIDKSMANEALTRYGKRGLIVIYGDAVSPNTNLSEKRNLMIVNPPYNRHTDIPKDYKVQITKFASEQTGIRINGDAGLYVYHLLIMDKWLENGGIAVWLIPTIFLQARYGNAIRKYLTSNVELLAMHIYKDEKQQFDNTDISTTIVAFRKSRSNIRNKIQVSYGESISDKSVKRINITEDILIESENWRKSIFQLFEKNISNEVYKNDKDVNYDIKFQDLFFIKRGVATGANSFFVLNRSEVDKLQIPEIAYKPVLPKSRFLNSNKIVETDNDGFPNTNPQLILIDCSLSEKEVSENYPVFYNYLQKAYHLEKNDKNTIVERTLVKSRKPWYKQEIRDPAPFLLTYMGRGSYNSLPLYFILNKTSATALNTYILLYPKIWLQTLLDNDNLLYEQILKALNFTAKSMVTSARIYAGGLKKIEPGDLKNIPIENLPTKITSVFKNING